MRAKLVPFVVLLMGLATIAAIWSLQQRAGAARQAELDLAGAKLALSELQTVPFRARAATGGSPTLARRQMESGEREIGETLDDLRQDSPPMQLDDVPTPLRSNFHTLDQIYAIGASGAEFGPRADHLGTVAAGSNRTVRLLFDGAALEYDRRATRSQHQATFGSAAAILLLLAGFGIFYGRARRQHSIAVRLGQENERLLEATREEALTDSLTGLRNRRALVNDLEARLARSDGDGHIMLAIYDLDGFKQYNDTFGHPAGDALLVRLAERLRTTLGGRGTAYRMGGDEFCTILPVDRDESEEGVLLAASSLSEEGDAFEIRCSYGVARMPIEADTGPDALRLADQRMYAQKATRTAASQQSTDVLLAVLSERDADLHDHITDVADLARVTAQRLGMSEEEVKTIQLAASLHDIGKTAIPETILDKPAELDEVEWSFIRRHTVIGERIVRAAPSLARVAELVRSSHERFDGSGYPDGLLEDQVPLGAAVIAVCDAFNAMISERPYSAAMSAEEALEELQRCAGTQFHPRVVEAFPLVAAEAQDSLQAA